jgi:hypothetical protein
MVEPVESHFMSEDQMTKEWQSTYPLRLPRSVKAEVERRAKADGVSIVSGGDH